MNTWECNFNFHQKARVVNPFFGINSQITCTAPPTIIIPKDRILWKCQSQKLMSNSLIIQNLTTANAYWLPLLTVLVLTPERIPPWIICYRNFSQLLVKKCLRVLQARRTEDAPETALLEMKRCFIHTEPLDKCTVTVFFK